MCLLFPYSPSRCAIYRLPDAHKHITRPPAWVVFPKKVLSCHVLCLSLTFLLLVVYLLFLFLHSVSIYKASTCTDVHLCFCDKPLCVCQLISCSSKVMEIKKIITNNKGDAFNQGIEGAQRLAMFQY